MQKKSSAILQFIVLYSENGKQDPLFITNYAMINVLDVLSRTPGVGQALLFGALKYSMRIWFDIKRLTTCKLAPSDVIAAIQAQNVQAPVGRIGARPISNDQQFQMNIQTQGRLTTPEQFGDIVLRANPDGSLLRIRDVARVEIGAQNEDIEGRLNGKPAVAIGIYLSPGANAVQTAAWSGQRCDAWAALPAGPQISGQLRLDDLRHRHDPRSVEDAGRGLRAGRDRGVSVPWQSARHGDPGDRGAGQPDRHVRGAAAVGYSANTVSLLAMVLAIGIVVDDAIVVVENVERVHGGGAELSPAEATKKAMTADHRRRSSPSRWCCCRCSCRSRSFPAFRASCSASSRSRSASRC